MRRPQYRPQYTIVLTIGTPKRVPIILGNPYVQRCDPQSFAPGLVVPRPGPRPAGGSGKLLENQGASNPLSMFNYVVLLAAHTLVAQCCHHAKKNPPLPLHLKGQSQAPISKGICLRFLQALSRNATLAFTCFGGAATSIPTAIVITT